MIDFNYIITWIIMCNSFSNVHEDYDFIQTKTLQLEKKNKSCVKVSHFLLVADNVVLFHHVIMCYQSELKVAIFE